jgi:hypothetical protein
MTTNAYPVLPIWNELARLLEAELKSSMGLKSIIQGSFASQPTPGLATLVPGIWVHPSPAMTVEETEMPRVMIQKHNFRLIYLRKMGLNENPTQITAADAVTIANMLTANFTLPAASMPANAQILWMMVRTVEFEPQEDDLVATISADVRAAALQVEVTVRVNAR